MPDARANRRRKARARARMRAFQGGFWVRGKWRLTDPSRDPLSWYITPEALSKVSKSYLYSLPFDP